MTDDTERLHLTRKRRFPEIEAAAQKLQAEVAKRAERKRKREARKQRALAATLKAQDASGGSR